jgi:hypothetical protein
MKNIVSNLAVIFSTASTTSPQMEFKDESFAKTFEDVGFLFKC